MAKPSPALETVELCPCHQVQVVTSTLRVKQQMQDDTLHACVHICAHHNLVVESQSNFKQYVSRQCDAEQQTAGSGAWHNGA